MNFDTELDDGWSAESPEFLPSPEVPRTDTVRWLNSQPPPELREIMLQVPKPRRDCELKPETTWPWYDDESMTSTSYDTHSVRSRPLARTNSSSRMRLSLKSGSNSPNMSSAGVHHLNSKDHDRLLSVFRGASEQLDESVAMRVAQCRETVGVKRKSKGSFPYTISKTAKIRLTSVPSLPSRILARDSRVQSTKEREMEIFPPEGSRFAGSNRSSLLSSSSSSSSASSKSMNMSMTMDVDSPDTSVDMDNAEHVHVPLVLDVYPQVQSLSASSASATHQTPLTGAARFNPMTPAPRLHHLLVERQSKRRPQPRPPSLPPPAHPQPQPLPLKYSPLPPSQGAPVLSQSPHRPPLGMRRVRTTPIGAQPLPLPTHQKSFKPPINIPQPLRQPSPQSQFSRSSETPNTTPKHSARIAAMGSISGADKPRSTSNSNSTRSSQLARTSSLPERKIEVELEEYSSLRAPSPDVAPEADSSFGDMSFDMDALEETMRKYD